MSVMDWRAAAAKRGLVVTDLAEHVGTEIGGIFLGDDHDAETIALIRAACVERTLLLFRGQTGFRPQPISPSPSGSAAAPTCIRCATTVCPNTTRSSWSAMSTIGTQGGRTPGPGRQRSG